MDRYMATPDDELPEGFSRSDDSFAFGKALKCWQSTRYDIYGPVHYTHVEEVGKENLVRFT